MIRVLVVSASALCIAVANGQEPLPTSIVPRGPAGIEEASAVLLRDPRSLAHPEHLEVRGSATPGSPSKASSTKARVAAAAIREQDLPRAITALYAILDATPDDPPALYALGVSYFRLQRYGDAAWVLERFLALAPEKIGQTRALGHCYYSLGDYARAKAHYARVLAASPDEAEAWRGLALCEVHLGDANRALELLERVLALRPDHADAWTWKAQLLFESERTEEALSAARRARDLDRWRPRPWYLLGRILLDLGQEQEATLAEARYRTLAEATDALHSIESHLEVHPHDLAARIRELGIHRATGNAPEVRRTLARLTVEKPDDVQLRILALDALEEVGDVDGARAAAAALEQRAGEDVRGWQRLERYYGRVGNRLEQVRSGEHWRRIRSRR